MWNLKQYIGNPALKDDNGHVLDYAELYEETEKLAAATAGRCLVISLCSNTLGSVIGYVSFLNNRIVPIMLNSDIDTEMLKKLIELYKPRYLWLPDGKTGFVKGAETVYAVYGYQLIQTEYREIYPLYSELALLLTTSGSTGSPKLVRQSYENISSNTQSIIEYLKLEKTERSITTLPMNYTYGLSIINTHIAVGATLLLTDKGIMQKGFWSFFKEKEATSFGGVPYTYEILDKLRFYNMELPSLRTMTQAGGKLIPELHEKFAKHAEKRGQKFVVMYGQCEATARMGYLPPDKAVEKKGSMGIAIPGGRFHLIDGEGQEITDSGITGELVYEGKNVTLGYAMSKDDLAKGDERKGRLETGDMAQFDEDGYYYIVGRKKRFLKVYGNRVNLDEMERLIRGRYGIEAACAGIDDHLYVFLTDNSLAGEIKKFAAKKTRLNPVAFSIKVLAEIPKNESGKVRYSELSRYYENI